MSTKTHTLDDELSAIDWCYEQGWTDGLPVVPPERERVERFLMAAGRPPEEVVARHPATGRECSVQSAAVNAVMAGCLPQYFPTVLAALEGLNEDAYNFHGSTASTGGSAPVVVISGDIRDEIGMNASVNVFGPGNRANATIGRAIRLVIMNIFQMIPGISDRSTTGWPGKYGCCIAENVLNSPWEPLHESLGFPPEVSTATVFAASGFYNVENHYTSDAERLLDTFADAMAIAGGADRRAVAGGDVAGTRADRGVGRDVEAGRAGVPVRARQPRSRRDAEQGQMAVGRDTRRTLGGRAGSRSDEEPLPSRSQP